LRRKSLNSIRSWQSGGGQREKKGVEGCYRATAAVRGDREHSFIVEASSPGLRQPASAGQRAGGGGKAGKKHRRRLSDAGKSGSKKAISRTTVSASCSPALTRKSSLDMAADAVSSNNNQDQSCSGAVSSMSNKVSDDINEMVEQIQAIQIDISELAGRPISLVGTGSKR
jgi:hypothetical protein